MKIPRYIWKGFLQVFVSCLLLSAGGCDDNKDEVLPDNDTPGKVFDIEGNEYKTVKIGDQIWMAENLRVTKYNNGDKIPNNLSDTEWGQMTEGAYAIYNPYEANTVGIHSSNEMVSAYGKLYNWFAVDDRRGLCPSGWRVPTEAERAKLVDYVVSQGYQNEWLDYHYDDLDGAGNALKSCRQEDSPLGGSCNTPEHPRWDSPSPYEDKLHHGFDAFDFSALPAGARNHSGYFSGIGEVGCWWTSTGSSTGGAYYLGLGYDDGVIPTISYDKRMGYSIRCIKD